MVNKSLILFVSVCHWSRVGVTLPSFIYLFIWDFTSLSTLYRSYHDGQLEGQRKPVHTVRQSSVL